MNIKEAEILYKRGSEASKVIRAASDMYEVAKPYFAGCVDHHEEMRFFALNSANRVFASYLHSKGGLDASIFDPKQIAQFLILSNARAAVMVHNHPSGNTEPSREDIAITKSLKDALKLFEIALLDHLILTSDSYTAFSERGIV